MFNRKRKKYVILVLSPKIGYFAKAIGQYASVQEMALRLSKQDAEALHDDMLHLGFVATILEHEGGEAT